MPASALHHALLQPTFYPHRPATVGFRETHVSRLYFAGNFVYKVKKPVSFGFLDFSTLSRRAFFCREELRLNQRFAPDTYLRVAKIRRNADGFNLDGRGEIVEYAVVMRLLPEERLLPQLLAKNDPALPRLMLELARRLAELHRQSPVCHDGGRHLARVRRNWTENFSQSRHLVGVTLNAATLTWCEAFVGDFCSRRQSLFKQREDEGKVRDGHGDLHVEHICCTEPLRIFDCIEFNRRFRQGDIVADIAFLLMDLDFRGRSDLATLLRDEWCRQLAEEPATIAPLLGFYKLYRAFVRGKVDSFLAEDPAAPAATRSAAAADARRYFALALGYLTPPTLILTCGRMGVGKSTLARPLAAACRGVQLRSDVIRKELAGLTATTAVHEDFATGLYAPQHDRATYARLLELARTELAAGRSVIVDAAFARRADRDAFRQLAASLQRPCLLLHLQCDEAILLARLDQRLARGDDPSDGRRALLNAQRQTFAPPTSEEGALQLDTSLAAPDHVEFVLGQLLHHHGFLRQ